MSPSRWKLVGGLVLVGFFVLFAGSLDSPDVEIFGASVPGWLPLTAGYLLGVVAGAAAVRSQR